MITFERRPRARLAEGLSSPSAGAPTWHLGATQWVHTPVAGPRRSWDEVCGQHDAIKSVKEWLALPSPRAPIALIGSYGIGKHTIAQIATAICPEIMVVDVDDEAEGLAETASRGKAKNTIFIAHHDMKLPKKQKLHLQPLCETQMKYWLLKRGFEETRVNQVLRRCAFGGDLRRILCELEANFPLVLAPAPPRHLELDDFFRLGVPVWADGRTFDVKLEEQLSNNEFRIGAPSKSNSQLAERCAVARMYDTLSVLAMLPDDDSVEWPFRCKTLTRAPPVKTSKIPGGDAHLAFHSVYPRYNGAYFEEIARARAHTIIPQDRFSAPPREGAGGLESTHSRKRALSPSTALPC
jgi:hypothetical protein